MALETVGGQSEQQKGVLYIIFPVRSFPLWVYSSTAEGLKPDSQKKKDMV